jgi:hypothetical protein
MIGTIILKTLLLLILAVVVTVGCCLHLDCVLGSVSIVVSVVDTLRSVQMRVILGGNLGY